MAELRVGASGFSFASWRPGFYPPGTKPAGFLAYYAEHLETVEINNSFYRLPPPETFAKWREQAPPHFLYAVKASRFLTHMKKLKDPHDPLERFFDNAAHLAPCLGPVLYQLPPRFPLNLERFEIFLRAIAPAAQAAGLQASPSAGGILNVVEFRDPSWYDERVYELLRRYDVSLCLHDMQGSASGRLVVGPFVYVRFHFGTTKYGGRYPDERLDEWAEWLSARAAEGLRIFAYFNNDTGGHAPRDAVRLRARIEERVGVKSQVPRSKFQIPSGA